MADAADLDAQLAQSTIDLNEAMKARDMKRIMELNQLRAKLFAQKAAIKGEDSTDDEAEAGSKAETSARSLACPKQVNAGVFDPTSASPEETTVLSPKVIRAILKNDSGVDIPAGAKVLVGGDTEMSIIQYLVNTLHIRACIAATKLSPVPPWLAPVADDAGKHPLHWACMTTDFNSEVQVDLVRALLECRSDPNCRDTDMFGMQLGSFVIRDLATKCGGKTPLHHLCFVKENEYSLQALSLLQEYGANALLEDSDGNTAAALAQMKGNTAICEALGASPLSEGEAEEQKKVFERRCLEREELWKIARVEERVRVRQEYSARLKSEYIPKHIRLYSLTDYEDVFEPSFLEAVKVGTKEAFEKMHDFEKLSDGLYKYRIFREEVCRELMEEVDHFNEFACSSGLPVTRPNSMNRYGLILNDIGFLSTMDALMHQFVQPFATAFFSERLGTGFALQSQHTFIVRYKMGEDLDLKTHRDDSDLTLNICLGKEFQGATLYFHKDRGAVCGSCRTNDEDEASTHRDRVAEEFQYPHPTPCAFCTFKYVHTPGVGLFHTGAHVHGVEKLSSGERSNLILWCRKRDYKSELRHELDAAAVQKGGYA